jgi:hypothetical protein
VGWEHKQAEKTLILNRKVDPFIPEANARKGLQSIERQGTSMVV